MRGISFVIGLLFVVTFTLPSSVSCGGCNATSIGIGHCTQSSTLRPIVDRVFSRKRRFLLLPKGAALKATIQFTKRLLAVVPRGFNFVLELALYYPCPSSRTDVIPKRFRKPTTTTPKPSGPPTPPLLVYLPGSDIGFKAKPVAKPKKPIKPQRIDESGGVSPQWLEPKPTHAYAHPQAWQQWSKYGTAAYQHKYDWTPVAQATQWQPSAVQQNKWTKWATSAPVYKWNKWTTPPAHTRWTREGASTAHTYEDPETVEYRPMYFEDLEPFDKSKHYHSHRDRRQLFAQFEPLTRILGIDMKACVLRAVCESKRLLLPPGYSLLQDVMRLILTFPAIDGLNDEYSRLMRTDYATCHERLRQKCSVSLLSWLLQPQHVTTL